MASIPSTRLLSKLDWLTASWRIYLFCLATSFFVMIEPAPTDLIFMLAVIAFVASPYRNVRLFHPVIVVGILMFLWFSMLAMIFVEQLVVAATRAILIEIYLTMLLAMTAYFACIWGDRAFRMITLMLIIGGLLASLIGILSFLDLMPNRQIFYRDDNMQRIQSTFKDPNVFGPYLVSSILATLWIVVSGEKWRWVAAVALSVLIFGIVVTFSRGAWAHLVISLGCFMIVLLTYQRTYLKTFGALIAIAALGMVAIVYYSSAFNELFEGSYFTRRLSFQSYDSKRFGLILRALSDMAASPLGIGPYQARTVYGWEPHNSFVLLGLQNGLLALAGYLILFIGAMSRCFLKMLRQENGWVKYAFLFSTLMGLLVLSNVVSSLHWRHLYVVLGLCFGEYKTNMFFEIKR